MMRALNAWLSSRRFWGGVAGLALALVFAAYLQADLIFDLATFVWSCF